MTRTCCTIELKVSFPATLENIDMTCSQLVNMLTSGDFEHVMFEAVLLAREALSNAVKHGSDADPNKTVSFKACLDESELTMEIQDEGPGFDWKRALVQETSPTKDSGRGLAIFVYYAQEVKFNKKGNKLFLRKDVICRMRDSYE